jgi:hypothetical protein
MTISIKPTASGSTIEQDGSTILTVDGSGNITPSNQLYPKVPAFSAYASANQAFSTNTFTKIQFNTEDFDTSSAYDTTNYRFTPQVAGYYQVNITYKIETVANRAVLSLHKNGSEYKRVIDVQSTYTRITQGSCLVYLNGSTDYIEAYGLSGSNTTAIGISVSQFSAHLVSV